jgi:hypothetical protein
MTGRRRSGRTGRTWLTTIAIAAALALSAAACDRNVSLGVDPGSDASIDDGGDAGASD